MFLQVGQQTAIAHEGHDDVRGWTSISAHPDQTNNIRVIEALHFYALRHHVINIFTTEVSWSYNKLSYLLGLSANIHTSDYSACTFQCFHSHRLGQRTA